jgi:hypothetical protein
MTAKKPIKMPKKLLAKWLAALRSGKYKQGRRTLYNPKEDSFCCLGVLQHVASNGKIEINATVSILKCPVFLDMPSLDWLKENKIEFLDQYGDVDEVPYLTTLRHSAASVNDARAPARRAYNFNDIADAIEACAEGT